MNTKKIATIYAVLAAALYAINVPLSKLLMQHAEPTMMAAFLLGERIPDVKWILCILLLGFAAYGLSIHFYIMAQKDLGAAKTSAYYSIAPFLGVMFSMILLREKPEIQFYIALVIMFVSTYFMVKDTIELQHNHEHEHIHTHEHMHGDTVHTHSHSHIHSHIHVYDGDSENHKHKHTLGEHNHAHSNIEVTP